MSNKNVWKTEVITIGDLTCKKNGTKNYLSGQPCRKRSEGHCTISSPEQGAIKKLRNIKEYPIAFNSPIYLIGYKLKMLQKRYNFRFINIKDKEVSYIMNPSIYQANAHKLYNVEDYFSGISLLKGYEGAEKYYKFSRSGVRFIGADNYFVGLTFYRNGEVSTYALSGDLMFQSKAKKNFTEIKDFEQRIYISNDKFEIENLQKQKEELIDDEIFESLDNLEFFI